MRGLEIRLKDVNELIFSYKICIAKNLKFDWLHKGYVLIKNKVHNSDLSVDLCCHELILKV